MLHDSELPTCPECGASMTLSGPLMQIPVCLKCHPPKVKLVPGKRKNDYNASVYHTQKTMDARIFRPPTEQEILDTVLDDRIRAQLKQCKFCKYSGYIGGNLFCDYIIYEGHSTDKGSGPGDCKSFKEKEGKKISKRKPPILY